MVPGCVTWLVTRWRLDATTLVIETGLIRRSSRRLPLARLQAVDVVQPLIAKMFGLAEIRLRLAGSSRVDGRLAYLHAPEAGALRQRLLAGHEIAEPEHETPKSELLATVHPGRLVASVFLSGYWAVAIAVFVVGAAALPGGSGKYLGSVAVSLFYVGLGLWRRVNAEYGFSVAHAPEGLRIQSGLLQTVNETIPRARIQSVRRVEPLLWRAFGWCRLEISVASGQSAGGNRSQTKRLTRALLPVGLNAEADILLAAVIGTDLPTVSRPPLRALFRSPLRYHFLNAGVNEKYAVAATGRICRQTSFIPLAKVQSIRKVQGPIERLMLLASVFVDVAGRRSGAKFRFRDAEDANNLAVDLIWLCKEARQ